MSRSTISTFQLFAMFPDEESARGYSLALGWDVTIFLSDADCKAIMDALGGRPPLPETDAQIDAAREDSAYAPGAGDVEVLRG